MVGAVGKTDLWLQSLVFHFFRTGLEKTLHDQEVTLCALAGITTHFVFVYSMDAYAMILK